LAGSSCTYQWTWHSVHAATVRMSVIPSFLQEPEVSIAEVHHHLGVSPTDGAVLRVRRKPWRMATSLSIARILVKLERFVPYPSLS
jgi:hypothetical protein